MPIRTRWTRKPSLGVTINWSNPLAKGLVGCWLFNEGGGGIVRDLSLNGNPGQLINFAFPPTATSGWNPGSYGPTLILDGSDFVTIDHTALLDFSTIDFTITAGIKAAGGVADEVTIFSKGDGGTNPRLLLKVEDDVGDTLLGTTTSVNVTGSTNVLDGVYHVVSFVRRGGNLYLYVDGNLDGSTISGAVSVANTTDVNIGRSWDGASARRYWRETIDFVSLHSRGLATAEVFSVHMRPWQMFDKRMPVWVVAPPPLAIPRHPATIFQIPALV